MGDPNFNLNTIGRAGLAEAIGAGTVTVVDALPPAPYANRHLPGALNLAIEEIADAGQVLPDRTAPIVTYSTDAACSRGPELAEALIEVGYTDVRNYADGIADWAAAGLPLESGVTPVSSGTAARGRSDEEAAIRSLVGRWAELERTQNADGLAGLLTDRFTGIGPVGFVLDAHQWADRHRDDDLVNHSFEVSDLEIVVEADAALVNAVQTQRTTARGHRNDGSFRTGLTLVRTENDWKIARIQLSGPMIQPGQAPPFAQPTHQQ